MPCVRTVICVHLCKQPPPLPVPEFKVRGTVPLHHPHSAQLLLLLHKGPETKTNS